MGRGRLLPTVRLGARARAHPIGIAPAAAQVATSPLDAAYRNSQGIRYTHSHSSLHARSVVGTGPDPNEQRAPEATVVRVRP